LEFLYLLERIRNPVLDFFMAAITFCGGEVVFMAIAITVFWCFSKKNGYYLLTTCFVGTLLNQFLKLMFRIPRPWVKDPDFSIVESAREEATGYSFPSGHTQNVTGTFGGIARFSKKKWLRAVCIVIILLTAFSRMYLGVHTLLDVGVSLVLGTALVFALYPVFRKTEEKPETMYWLLGVMGVLALVYVIFLEVHTWPADIDAGNLASGMKNGYTMLGCVAGMALAYFLDQKYVHFDVKAPFWAQVLKVVLGLAIVMGVKEGMKPILNPIFNGHASASAVRYFLVVVAAAGIWPMTFGWFGRGCKKKK